MSNGPAAPGADPLVQAEAGLAEFARRHGIDWPAARTQLTDADVVSTAPYLPLASEQDMLRGWLRVLVRRSQGENI